MENFYKLYTAATRRRRNSSRQGRDDASPQLELDTIHVSTAEPHQPQDEHQQLPHQPETLHLMQRSVGNADDDDITAKPRKLNRLAKLAALTNVVSIHPRKPATPFTTNSPPRQRSELLGRFLRLPVEMQLEVLEYLNFGELENLRRTCHAFRTCITPQTVRLLLRNSDHQIRHTCYICLKQHGEGRNNFVTTDRFHPRFPFSSRCVDCVWDARGFDVGRRYLMIDNTALFVCRWCGRPATQPLLPGQPQFHKKCFERYCKVGGLYCLFAVAQWVVMIIASSLCWHYFRTRARAMWVVGLVVAGFIAAIWNSCLKRHRGYYMRTYHFSLVLEAATFVLWFVPLLQLFRINRERTPYRAMDSYERATVVFIIFNLVSRGMNVIGNFILMCEYKLWRHKKPHMSPLRSVWIRALEVFMFFVEPRFVNQEYPPRWWFSNRVRRRIWEIARDISMPTVGVSAAGQRELDEQSAVEAGQQELNH